MDQDILGQAISELSDFGFRWAKYLLANPCCGTIQFLKYGVWLRIEGL